MEIVVLNIFPILLNKKEEKEEVVIEEFCELVTCKFFGKQFKDTKYCSKYDGWDACHGIKNYY